MKKNRKSRHSRATPRPTKRAYTVLRQLVQWIPPGLADSLAKEAKADIRSFSAFSHVLALLHGQITKAGSLNEICDAAKLHEPELNRIRGATAPKRNTFSNANRSRDPAHPLPEAHLEMGPELFTAGGNHQIGHLDENRPRGDTADPWDSQ